MLRGLASTDRIQVGHFTDSDVVLDFLARDAHPRLAALGTSCPDHFLRTKIRPMVLDLPPSAPMEAVQERLQALHAAYREDYAAYYARHASPDSPTMRGADPAIVLVPGVGMFSFGATKQTARVAGEFYVNAINVMRGAEAVSTYAPIPEAEKFRIEYWALEEAKLTRLPAPRPLAGRVALVTGAASGIGKAIATRLAQEGACVVVADIDAANAEAVAAELGGPDVARSVLADVTDEEAVADAFRTAILAFGGVDLVVNNAGLSISKPLLETTVRDWDLQHDVMARGSFLVSREAARIMIDQGLGGDLIYIVSKNAFFAGPNNVAYGAAKADQAHQVRLLAAELGEYGIRVNGVNPDGVVRGSGIFAKGWGADRARTYGIPEDKLGEFYAQRTLAEAGGPSRARGRGGLRARRGRPVADHRAPHPGRCRGRRRLPAVSADAFAAVDIGASSGRVVIGRATGKQLQLRRSPPLPEWASNRPSTGCAGTPPCSDVISSTASGPRGRQAQVIGIGIDTWGVDYGLIDTAGALLADPYAYRDARTGDRRRARPRRSSPRIELYRRNGLQFLPFNTLYQLAADDPHAAGARSDDAADAGPDRPSG